MPDEEVELESEEDNVEPQDVIEVRDLILGDGRVPYKEWYGSLRDKRTRIIIENRIARVRSGNLGDVRSVGKGIFELRIHYGPGYRVYFGKLGEILVILVGGGDKSTQDKDIITAQRLWEENKERVNEDEKPS